MEIGSMKSTWIWPPSIGSSAFSIHWEAVTSFMDEETANFSRSTIPMLICGFVSIDIEVVEAAGSD